EIGNTITRLLSPSSACTTNKSTEFVTFIKTYEKNINKKNYVFWCLSKLKFGKSTRKLNQMSNSYYIFLLQHYLHSFLLCASQNKWFINNPQFEKIKLLFENPILN